MISLFGSQTACPCLTNTTVFFDWDGTITDSIEGNWYAAKSICRERAPSLEPEVTLAEMKAGMDLLGPYDYFDALLGPTDPPRSHQEISDAILLHRDGIPAPIFPDVKPAMDLLRQAGAHIGLISLADRERLASEVAKSGLVFDEICWDGEASKSDRIRQSLAARNVPLAELGRGRGCCCLPSGQSTGSCPPGSQWPRACYIGDDINDMIEARKVPGVLPLAVARGASSKRRLSRLACCFDTVMDAVEYILGT